MFPLMPKRPAHTIREDLNYLILQSESVDSNLAKRLKEIQQWIGKKKDGFLNSRPYVLDFLEELLRDSRFWLIIKPLSLIDRQEIYQARSISVARQYWLEVLFPAWINERDHHFPVWKQKMMSGEFQSADDTTIKQMMAAISSQNGSVMRRYILDLSMATDLLIARQSSLCIQLTSVTGRHLTEKQRKWQATLTYWQIRRGLLLSYSMMNPDYQKLARIALQESDSLPMERYNVYDDLS